MKLKFRRLTLKSRSRSQVGYGLIRGRTSAQIKTLRPCFLTLSTTRSYQSIRFFCFGVFFSSANCISMIWVLEYDFVQQIPDHSQTMHATEKLLSATSLFCEMGIIIFDLNGFGGCQRPRRTLWHFNINIRFIPQCQFCLQKEIKSNLNIHQLMNEVSYSFQSPYLEFQNQACRA